jgi:hypothetical protein
MLLRWPVVLGFCLLFPTHACDTTDPIAIAVINDAAVDEKAAKGETAFILKSFCVDAVWESGVSA